MSRGKAHPQPARDKHLSVHVPLTFPRRGGRRHVVTPEGVAWAPSRTQVDSTLVKALARAFRWQRLLDTGAYATIDELAPAEKTGSTYLCRVLRLTLLAPGIVEAMLDGKTPGMTLPTLMEPLPVDWKEQAQTFV